MLTLCVSEAFHFHSQPPPKTETLLKHYAALSLA